MTAQPIGRVGTAIVGVPDPDATAGFLRETLGFETMAQPDGWAIVCDGDYGPHGQIAVELRSAERTGLIELLLEVPGDYHHRDLAERATAAGGRVLSADRAHAAFVDVSGVAVRTVAGEARRVALPAPHPLRPRRLGHVNLKAPDPAVAARFWQAAVGLRLSEQIGERLFFLRIGSEHHNIGIRPGAEGDLHHLAFEIGGWHQYQPILDRLSALGHRVEYGPGRHTPGNNLFTYLCDPSSGLRLELFADMAQIPDGTAYEPKRWNPEDRFSQTLNRWGPLPPESFLA